MRLLACFVALVLGSTAAQAQTLAITGATVVDVRTGGLTQDQTLVIHDGRIVSISRDAPPADATLYAAEGRFVVPGYWDMVTHLSWTRESALPVLVANGVTAVRDEGGHLAETAIWAEEVRSGRRIGPTIHQVGPMLNGRSFNEYQFAVETPYEARVVVRLLKSLGVHGLEIERRFPRDAYFALMAEARVAGLPVGGKVPLEVTPTEAAEAGQATIDNLETIYDGRFREENEADFIAGMDAFLSPSGGGEALFETLRRTGVAVTPSLYALRHAIAYATPGSPPDPEFRYVARSQRKPIGPLPPQELAEFAAMTSRILTTITRLHEAGVTLLAGTDIAAYRTPGFSLHHELDVLAEAGLSPIEVLRTTTLNPAVVMKMTDDYGAVEPGKVADLIFLDRDPTQDVSALHAISAVVLHGRLLDRTALDAQLAEGAALAELN